LKSLVIVSVLLLFAFGSFSKSKDSIMMLNGKDTVYHEVKTPYKDDSITILKPFDTANIDVVSKTNVNVKVFGVYFYSFIARSSDRKINDTVTRIVIVRDHTPPVITLIGPATAEICQWLDYEDAGYTVTDNYDAVKNIRIDSVGFPVKTDSQNLVWVRYKATDKSGNSNFSEYRYILIISHSFPQCEGRVQNGNALFQVQKVEIYPNPSNGLLYISTAYPKLLSGVLIYNLNGQLVEQVGKEGFNFGKQQFDLSNQPTGIYFVRIETEIGSTVRKVVLSK